MSFAQFQADKAVVGLARQLTTSEDALAGYAEAATCERGDFMAYAALRQRVSTLEKDAARSRRADRRQEVLDSLAQLHRGDVIEVPGGKFAGYAVVLDRGTSAGRSAPPGADRRAPGAAAERGGLPGARDRGEPAAHPAPVQRAQPADPARPGLHPAQRDPRPGARRRPRRSASAGRPARESREIEELRRQLRDHPCHDCPDREDHARWAERWFKLDRDARTLRRRVDQRTNTVARQFDRVCEVLDASAISQATRSPPSAARCAGSTPSSTSWSPRPCGWASSTGSARRRSPPRSRRWSTRPGVPRTSSRPGSRAARPSGPIHDLERLWRELVGGRARPSPRLPAPARRRPGLGGVPLGRGRRPRRGARRHRPHRGRLRALGQAADRPVRPGRGRRRATGRCARRRATSYAGSAAASWPSPPWRTE